MAIIVTVTMLQSLLLWLCSFDQLVTYVFMLSVGLCLVCYAVKAVVDFVVHDELRTLVNQNNMLGYFIGVLDYEFNRLSNGLGDVLDEFLRQQHLLERACPQLPTRDH